MLTVSAPTYTSSSYNLCRSLLYSSASHRIQIMHTEMRSLEHTLSCLIINLQIAEFSIGLVMLRSVHHFYIDRRCYPWDTHSEQATQSHGHRLLSLLSISYEFSAWDEPIKADTIYSIILMFKNITSPLMPCFFFLL